MAISVFRALLVHSAAHDFMIMGMYLTGAAHSFLQRAERWVRPSARIIIFVLPTSLVGAVRGWQTLPSLSVGRHSRSAA